MGVRAWVCVLKTKRGSKNCVGAGEGGETRVSAPKVACLAETYACLHFEKKGRVFLPVLLNDYGPVFVA